MHLEVIEIEPGHCHKRGIALGPMTVSLEEEDKDEDLDVLKNRYASGEISKEEFERLKKELES